MVCHMLRRRRLDPSRKDVAISCWEMSARFARAQIGTLKKIEYDDLTRKLAFVNEGASGGRAHLVGRDCRQCEGSVPS